MSIFQPVTIKWDGVEYVIPADKVLGAIAEIEEHVTMQELHTWYERKSFPLAKLAKAIATVVRYAGGNVTDDETYNGLFEGGAANTAAAVLLVILQMMIPPEHLQKANAKLAKAEAGNAPAALTKGNRSSRRRSASLSRKGGQAPATSGD